MQHRVEKEFRALVCHVLYTIESLTNLVHLERRKANGRDAGGGGEGGGERGGRGEGCERGVAEMMVCLVQEMLREIFAVLFLMSWRIFGV